MSDTEMITKHAAQTEEEREEREAIQDKGYLLASSYLLGQYDKENALIELIGYVIANKKFTPQTRAILSRAMNTAYRHLID